MRFFKLVEIDEKEYVEQTRDLSYDRFCNTITKASDVHPEDSNIYIALNDDEDQIVLTLSDFENEEDDNDGEPVTKIIEHRVMTLDEFRGEEDDT